LGPGAEELTLRSSHHDVQVIGYDGRRRITIDLSALLDGHSAVQEIVWSPDGSRLAVVTREVHEGGHDLDIWLVDRDGGDPQRVHTAAYTGPSPADRSGTSAA
jgi:dipeptidyl aminopeptidase/acylaminoacyl peptidase